MNKGEKRKAGCAQCEHCSEAGGEWNLNNYRDPKPEPPRGWLGWCKRAKEAIIHLKRCPK